MPFKKLLPKQPDPYIVKGYQQELAKFGHLNVLVGYINTLQTQVNGIIGTPIKFNLTAVSDPTVNDDSSLGYSINSIWYNTITQTFWACLNPALGAAVWSDQVIGGAGLQNNMTAVVAPTVNDDSGLGYSVDSGWFNTVTGLLYFCQNATPGAAVWTVVPTSSGAGVLVITVAIGQALITGSGLAVNGLYNVTNAGSGKANLLIRARTATTFYEEAVGTFQNGNMATSVVASMQYRLTATVDNILAVYEPIRNNKVYAGIRPSTNLYENSVIDAFPFDKLVNKDNSFSNCQFQNFNSTAVMYGNTWENWWMNFGGFANQEFKNQVSKGVNNQLSGRADGILTGAAAVLECNDFWSNASDSCVKGLGPNAEVSYATIEWFSTLDMGGFNGGDFRFSTIRSTALVTRTGAYVIRYCNFGNGVDVSIGGTTLQCIFESGNQGGVRVKNFKGTGSTLINTSYDSNSTGLTCNTSILTNCDIQEAGSNNLIVDCDLVGTTVDFGVFTGCTLSGMKGPNQTYTFYANNQTISPFNTLTNADFLALSASGLHLGVTYTISDGLDGSSYISNASYHHDDANAVYFTFTKCFVSNFRTINRNATVLYSFANNAGDRIVSYHDALKNIHIEDVATVFLDSWLQVLSGLNVNINVRNSYIDNVASNVLGDNSTFINSTINVLLGATVGGTYIRSNIALVTGQSLTTCHVEDSSVDCTQLVSTYSQSGRRMTKGYSDFMITPTDAAEVNPDITNLLDMNKFAFAGILKPDSNANDLYLISPFPSGRPVTIAPSCDTFILQGTTGAGTFYLPAASVTLDGASTFDYCILNDRLENGKVILETLVQPA